MSYHQLAKEAIKRKKINDYKGNYQYLNEIMEKSLSQFEKQSFATIYTSHITPKEELIRLLRKEGFNIEVYESENEIKITPSLLKWFTRIKHRDDRPLKEDSDPIVFWVTFTILAGISLFGTYIWLWFFNPGLAILFSVIGVVMWVGTGPH